MASERSPGFKLFLAGIIGIVLAVPLMMIYALNWDRQNQSNTAQSSIAAGWGGSQVIVGPVLVIPYTTDSVETITNDGRETTRTVRVTKELYLAPETNSINTDLAPERKKKSIYESVLFVAKNRGEAHFALPADFARYGIPRDSLNLAGAELRFGVSDARGLQSNSKVSVNGKTLELQPGKGLAASNNSGFFTFVDWDGVGPLDVSYSYAIRGNQTLTMVPRGGETTWDVKSSWPSPNFTGDFIPTERVINDDGFTSKHKITNLALGQALVTTDDAGGPPPQNKFGLIQSLDMRESPSVSGPSQAAAIGLVEPVNLYSQVDRAIKYGFLFIGFTFLAFFMFDVVAGAKVAAAEYLLTGAGLVLFFVLLLAFAEVVGFMLAYLVAGGAITGLLTAYSAAVLKSWMRARVIGGLLVGLYAVLYTLLNLEAYSLLIGSLLLFAALAVVMWATRHIDWSAVGGRDPAAPPEPEAPKAKGRKSATATSTG